MNLRLAGWKIWRGREGLQVVSLSKQCPCAAKLMTWAATFDGWSSKRHGRTMSFRTIRNGIVQLSGPSDWPYGTYST